MLRCGRKKRADQLALKRGTRSWSGCRPVRVRDGNTQAASSSQAQATSAMAPRQRLHTPAAFAWLVAPATRRASQQAKAIWYVTVIGSDRADTRSPAGVSDHSTFQGLGRREPFQDGHYSSAFALLLSSHGLSSHVFIRWPSRPGQLAGRTRQCVSIVFSNHIYPGVRLDRGLSIVPPTLLLSHTPQLTKPILQTMAHLEDIRVES